ncbi:PspC domain-containing protein [Ligilactobacillus salivarius]
MKKLYRSNRNRIVGGVCGGIGEYLGIDAKYVRITFVALTIITSIFRPLSMVVPGIYIIMMLAIPVKKLIEMILTQLLIHSHILRKQMMLKKKKVEKH